MPAALLRGSSNASNGICQRRFSVVVTGPDKDLWHGLARNWLVALEFVCTPEQCGWHCYKPAQGELACKLDDCVWSAVLSLTTSYLRMSSFCLEGEAQRVIHIFLKKRWVRPSTFGQLYGNCWKGYCHKICGWLLICSEKVRCGVGCIGKFRVLWGRRIPHTIRSDRRSSRVAAFRSEEAPSPSHRCHMEGESVDISAFLCALEPNFLISVFLFFFFFLRSTSLFPCPDAVT